MADQVSNLILTLIDRVTGPARAVGASMASLQARLSSAAEANRQAMSRAQGQMFGAVAAAVGLKSALSAPLSIASGFETALLDIGQKADLSDASIKSLGERIRALAPTINQTSAEVAKGIDTLVGFGLDPGKAEEMLGPIGRTATAYNAAIADLSKAAFSAFDNLKLKAGEVGQALDIMAQSGKEGAFEIKDMAAQFPSLTASAQALGMTGVTAVGRLSAALQIARKGASDGSESATNVANLMQKIISPETTKKFTKLGVDIRKELKKVQKDGGDVFEFIAGATSKALKGDLSKIGDIFEDAQVQKFLRPLIQNMEEYKRVRDKALGASGVVDADFARRMLTNAAQTAAFTIRMKELGMTIGNILMPAMNQLMGSIAPVLKSFEKFSDAHPALVGGAIKVAAAMIALRVAAVGARFAMTFFGAAALTAMAPLRAIPALAGMAGAALLAMTRPLALVTLAMRVLKLAVMSTGIGLVLVGIGTAAAFVVNNFKGIGAAFGSFFDALTEGLKGDQFSGLVSGLERLGTAWKAVTGEIDAKKWQEWGAAAGTGVADAIKGIADALDRVVEKWESFKSVWNQIQDVLSFDIGAHVSGRIGMAADAADIRSKDGRPGQRAANTARREAINEERMRLGIPTIGAPAKAGASGGDGSDVWNKGAQAIKGLDMAGPAGAAGTSSGNAFTNGFAGELDNAIEMAKRAAQQIQSILNFNVSPTVTPKFSAASPGYSRPHVDAAASRQAAHSDGNNANFGTV